MTTALAENQRRRVKTDRMRARGVDPFPHFKLPHRSLVAELTACYDGGRALAEPQQGRQYRLAGRLVGRRKSGDTILLELRDRSGTIRLRGRPNRSSKVADIGEWDIGDIVAVAGHVSEARDGGVGFEVESGWLLTKALQLNHGLREAQSQSRRRELALMASAEHRQRVVSRAAVIRAIRDWMNRREFVEVETPILQSLAGGALARPFVTHHNSLDREVSLRISTQLYLRRCTIGDLERVYELGKCFRNEGMSARHSPEFAILEWSMAYSDYEDSAALAEQLIADTAKQVLGGHQLTRKGITIDLEPPWRRITLRDAIKETVGLDILASTTQELLAASRIEATHSSWSTAVHTLYGRYVEPSLTQPTIVLDFPVDSHPCMKRHAESLQIGESFDVVIGGVEMGSGGTEVNDPDEQRLRFVEQRGGHADGQEPHPNDREYVTALEYGAPPSSGAGIGIDRLVMVLLDRDSIEDITTFPTPG